MKNLTEKQKQLLNYLRNYIETNEDAPSYPEIQSYFGFASLSSVYKHLQVLKDKGFISINRQASNPISLTKSIKKPPSHIYPLPLLGYLNEDGEIEEVETVKRIDFCSNRKLSNQCFLLQIEGGNFLEAGLLHNDLIVVEPRNEAISGETVLAKVYSEQFVVKKYHPNGPYIRLDSFCMQVEPMVVLAEEVALHGVLLGVVRQYSI